eukprot:4037115-Amphidinium_carterae.1
MEDGTVGTTDDKPARCWAKAAAQPSCGSAEVSQGSDLCFSHWPHSTSSELVAAGLAPGNP